jgi:hypothetical protein
MPIDRRSVLRGAGSLGLVGVLLTGRSAQKAFSRSQKRLGLTFASHAILAEKAEEELGVLPTEARNGIRAVFDGLSIKVPDLARTLASRDFAVRLELCAREEQRRAEFALEFTRTIASEAEITDRIATIARETGSRLDQNWQACCTEVGKAWSRPAMGLESPPTWTQLADRCVPQILDCLSQARETALANGQRPLLGETIRDVGESAILLLPAMQVSKGLYLPLFAVAALGHVWQFLAGLFRDPRPVVVQQVSGHLAQLGRHLGDEFHAAIRTRIAALHGWQRDALDAAADDVARREVSWFF